MKYGICAAILISVFCGLSISSMLEQSGTCDEIAHHIPGGYSYYKKWDFRLNPSSPPLARYLAALPLNFINLKAPFDDKSWQEADTPAFGKKFFFEYNKGRSHNILFLSRAMMVLLGMLGAILLYVYSTQLYGIKSGLFALFLYCFTPEILAHSTLATTDIAAACFMLLALYTFWKFMRSPDRTKLYLAGIGLGLAQLSKYSAIILYPIFILLLTVEFISAKKISLKLIKALLIIFIISIITIWAGYGFRMKPFLAETINQQEKIVFVDKLGSRLLPFWNERLAQKTEALLKNTPLPLTTYTMGVFGIIKHNQEGHGTFFLGKRSGRGSVLYYLVAFLIKTPLPIIILLFTAIFSFKKKRMAKNDLYLIVPVAVIFLAASVSNLQLGIRYILPIYPLCLIFSSRIIPLIKDKWHQAALVLLSAWLMTGNIYIWPYYLSYFNESIGGPNNGWKYLRDSNIDWGQDLPALAKYMRKNNINEITFEYFGQDNPAVYGISSKPFSDKEYIVPQKKVYAISVHLLENAAWASRHKPTAKAGYSIFIYDFRKK